ncbi:MAG: hypothetical protein HKN62_09405 [Phycisphaerales bacterium]|nr:hypothetical protein [Phycisphaerales bacterium]
MHHLERPDVGDACDFLSDDGVDAIAICRGTLTGSTVGATPDGESSCSPAPELNHDVWYSYTPTADDSVTISGCDAPFSFYLSVHDGCPGTPANEIGCALYGCSAWLRGGLPRTDRGDRDVLPLAEPRTQRMTRDSRAAGRWARRCRAWLTRRRAAGRAAIRGVL